ncbi:MAG: hypothetical protein LT071_12755 [Nocardioides sp.]|nr:hypothetical protein [Nocardioides sp.]
MDLTQLPLRVATGAFILNSGVAKLSADEGTAQFLHQGAKTAVPGVFDSMDAKSFARVLSYSEIGIGALLLAPMVPATVAGAALTGFGAGLVRMYLKTPGMTQSDGIRPTQEGTALAKDVWLLGAGLTLFSQGVVRGTKKGAKAVAEGVKSVTPFVD